MIIWYKILEYQLVKSQSSSLYNLLKKLVS